MGIKAARQGFSKDEILEILKRNVALFKNEPEFVDYIVNLALYLIDQQMVSGEGTPAHAAILARMRPVPQDADELDEPVPPALLQPGGRTPPPAGDSPTRKPELPPSVAQRRASSPAPQSRTSVPALALPPPASPPGIPGSFRTSSLNLPAPSAPPPPPPPEKPGASSQLRQLASPGQMTPIPENARRPKIEIGDQGKTRVYKVVRSYSANDGERMYCPICGTDTGGESKCPNCGHLV